MNILITGSKSGIGLKTALLLSKEHYIYLTVHRKESINGLEELLENNKNIEIFKLDITNKKDIESLDNLEIDVLINNAATCESGSILEIPVKNLKNNFSVNVFNTILLTQHIFKSMYERKKGKIIFVSSYAGILPIPFLGSYGATKSSINYLSECMYKELKYLNSNVYIKLVLLGAYKTGFNQYMVDTRLNWIDKNSYFNRINNKLYEEQIKMFDLIENKDVFNAAKEIVKAVNDKSNKFVYKAPFLQSLFIRFYYLFKRT